MKVDVLGVELELDIYDVDVFEKFEHEVNEVKRKADITVQGQTNAQKLRRHCAIVKEFFDNVFGAGTAKEVFGEKDNIKDCTDAYLTVIETMSAASSQYTAAIDEKREAIESRYTPEEDDQEEIARQQAAFRKANTSQFVGNRAQRRNSGKKKKR